MPMNWPQFEVEHLLWTLINMHKCSLLDFFQAGLWNHGVEFKKDTLRPLMHEGQKLFFALIDVAKDLYF